MKWYLWFLLLVLLYMSTGVLIGTDNRTPEGGYEFVYPEKEEPEQEVRIIEREVVRKSSGKMFGLFKERLRLSLSWIIQI